MIKNSVRKAFLGGAAILITGSASAAMYDLSGGDNTVTVTGGTGGDAVFSNYFDQPAGTGYIRPFLRTQLQGQPGDYCTSGTTGRCEQGYNTDSANSEFDTKDDNKWNHALMLADIPVVNEGGSLYREFFLDINQNQGNPDQEFLSFDELQFFISDSSTLSNYNDSKNLFPGSEGASLVWELDAYNGGRTALTADNWLLLENCRSVDTCGSGDVDIRVLIPNEVFGADNTKFVTLFNRFGDSAGSTGANDGFEEWFVRSAVPYTPPGVPEPGILSLLSVGLFGMVAARRRKA